MRWFALCMALQIVVPCGVTVADESVNALSLQADVASPADAVVLDDNTASENLWNAVRVLRDPEHSLTLAEARDRVHEFERANVPSWNFGDTSDVLWLHLPIAVANGDGRWILDIDYAPLQGVDIYLYTEGQLREHHRIGSDVPLDERAVPGSTPNTRLQLAPGVSHELLLRISSTTSMVLPLTLQTPERYYPAEQNKQLFLGLSAGVYLALILYSLVHLISVRDALFGIYALYGACIATFYLAFNGVVQQLVLPTGVLLSPKLLPVLVLCASFFACHFVIRSLKTRTAFPLAHRGLTALSVVFVAVIALSLGGVLNYHQTQIATSMMGPLVPLIAVPVTFIMMRVGDTAARYMLLGWGCYLIGALTFSAMLRGLVPASFWSMHLFQIGGLMEMLMWLRVLSLHMESVRREAERGEAEREALIALSRTDALTGLANRRGLVKALERLLPGVGSSNHIAIYFLDLDGFKAVNDQYGHEVGDHLLIGFAQRLGGCLREDDVVARLGGDEFVVIASDIGNAERAQALGERLLATVKDPYEFSQLSCRVGVTIGYVVAPDDGVAAEELLKLADSAMYAGKMAGKRCLTRVETDLPDAA